MSKGAVGTANWHVLGSGGPSANPFGFYSTTYSTTYKSEGGDDRTMPGTKILRQKLVEQSISV